MKMIIRVNAKTGSVSWSMSNLVFGTFRPTEQWLEETDDFWYSMSWSWSKSIKFAIAW